MGISVPTWLSSTGPVYLKRHARAIKNEPFVDEVDLVHTTPTYALVRFPSGRETTVWLRDVAPTAPEFAKTPGTQENVTAQSPADPDRSMQFSSQSGDEDVVSECEANSPLPVRTMDASPQPIRNSDANSQSARSIDLSPHTEQVLPRRSSRVRKPVDHYGDVVYF